MTRERKAIARPRRLESRSEPAAIQHAAPLADGANEQTLDHASAQLRRRVDRLFSGSLHIRHVDSGSCNACESEIKLLTSPCYDLHRLGIFFTPSPRHADLLLVTGPVTRAMEGPLLRTYEAMPDPRLVVAVGACACGGGVFSSSAYVRGSLEGLLPVDVYIPGCPPTPIALIYGLLLATNRVKRTRKGIWFASEVAQAQAWATGTPTASAPTPNTASSRSAHD